MYSKTYVQMLYTIFAGLAWMAVCNGGPPNNLKNDTAANCLSDLKDVIPAIESQLRLVFGDKGHPFDDFKRASQMDSKAAINVQLISQARANRDALNSLSAEIWGEVSPETGINKVAQKYPLLQLPASVDDAKVFQRNVEELLDRTSDIDLVLHVNLTHLPRIPIDPR